MGVKLFKCETCKWWGVDALEPDALRAGDKRNDYDQESRECGRLGDFCCRGRGSDMPAGVVGGGSFYSKAEFGCVAWVARWRSEVASDQRRLHAPEPATVAGRPESGQG